MQRLLLIRHAHSQHHEQGLTGGWTNTPLSQRGHRQAQLLAARCRQLVIDEPAVAVVSSDLARAAQTATYIAQTLQVDVHFDPALRELNNGAAAGLSQAQAAHIALPPSEPTVDWIPYPQAESWRMLQERIWTGMAEIACRSLATTVIVSHGNAGIAVIHWWLGLCAECRGRVSFTLDPASITELAVNRWQERTIVRLNDTHHLAAASSA